MNWTEIKNDIANHRYAKISLNSNHCFGWGNCRSITPTIEITKLNPVDTLYGERINGFNFLVEVYNIGDDDMIYYHHGKYSYCIGPDGPVFVDFDEDDRRYVFHPAYAGGFLITPLEWGDEDKNMLNQVIEYLISL